MLVFCDSKLSSVTLCYSSGSLVQGKGAGNSGQCVLGRCETVGEVGRWLFKTRVCFCNSPLCMLATLLSVNASSIKYLKLPFQY